MEAVKGAYLLDTDAFSYLAKRTVPPSFQDWIWRVPSGALHLSAVTLGELVRGANLRRAGRDQLLDRLDRVGMSRLPLLPFDREVATRWGQLEAAVRLAGTPLGRADLQIAATALVYELELVTGNVRDYERIPGLRINRVFADSRTD